MRPTPFQRKLPFLSCLLIGLVCASPEGGAASTELDSTSPPRPPLVLIGSLESAADPSSLSFGRTGRIARVNVKVGDAIRRSQLLARLDCSDAEAELAMTEAELELQREGLEKQSRAPDPTDLEIAKNRLELAKADLVFAEAARKRLEAISSEKGMITRQEIEVAARRAMAARLDVSTAQRALDRLQSPPAQGEREKAAREKMRVAAVARARYQVSLCDITSPIDGIVTDIHARAGETIGALQPILAIAEGAGRRVLFCLGDLSSTVQIGQKLRARIPTPAGTRLLDGRITTITSATGSAPCPMRASLELNEALSGTPLHTIAYVHLQ